ncbi:DUF2484 family protein [Nereida sp. MMG025]|uniref:DUF2484 family protein n=1 Tax=Nereida sp. MMG025 TaxID=2909981 RepID=UPI001F3B90EB|nr:DUF2484 family protein [Nereida sp. MMG025]MCF6445233.1 DUF2484 family protein [Nereida sp. MMG025]
MSDTTLAIVLICGWIVLAQVMQAIPSNDNHWRRAYVLIGVGIPLLGYATFLGGPWVGVIGLGVGMTVLRWPVWYGVKWLRRRLGL